MTTTAACYVHIEGLRLSSQSKEAIDKMSEIARNMKLVSTATLAAPLYSIFFRSNSVQASYNVAVYDWEQFATALSSLNRIERRMLKDVANDMRFKHSIRGLDRTGEGRFWNCMYEAL